jgi:LysR family transcriptional activator of mexEF-oprN operon
MKNMPDVYARDLDLNLLRVFMVVADESSVTRAAARLYVTQPAVSAAMRRLTSFVGADLFVRQGRGLVLTTRGADLLASARAHLQALIAATSAAPFDPRASTATVRIGLGDTTQSLLLPALLELLRKEAPAIRVVCVLVQFRNVEDILLSSKIDMAITVADALPRSILRQRLQSAPHRGFACVWDPRFVKLPRRPSEKDYFAREHVIVSYASDVRGIVEDSRRKARNVRVSVPSLGWVPDVVDGSPLIATLPFAFAEHVTKKRPHLRMAPLPFTLEGADLELLWSRVTDDDAALRFVRSLVVRASHD